MPYQCPSCGKSQFEKRGTVRRYITLAADLSDDTWTDSDDCECDIFNDGSEAEIIYCVACGATWAASELRAVVPA